MSPVHREDATVEWKRRGAVGWIHLNRPDRRNAINMAMRDDLERAFTGLDNDDRVRVIVLTGRGSAFCAGVDLHETTSGHGGGALDLGTPVSDPIEHCTRPVLAALNGPAVGGGAELALAADLRVAATTASFRLTELRIGSLPGSGGTQRLFSQLPSAVAWRMLLTGSALTAEDAGRFGLVSDVFPAESFAADVERLATEIAAAAPLSVRAAKIAARAAVDRSPVGLSLERVLWRMLAATEDRAEGRAAFQEKRAAQFRGR